MKERFEQIIKLYSEEKNQEKISYSLVTLIDYVLLYKVFLVLLWTGLMRTESIYFSYS